MPPITLHHLSLREKIGQTCQISGRALAKMNPDQLAAYFAGQPAGSIFLGSEIIGGNVNPAEALQRLIAQCQAASHVPLSVAGDLENGAGGAVRGLTAFPNLLALGAVDDPDAAYEYGRWTAVEALRAGFNWTFGPVVDLSLNWLNPIFSNRSLGDSPDRVAALATAFIRGCQENGLSATAKHYPGDGLDFRDPHLCVSVNPMSKEAWRATYGRIYRACFEAGVHSVMAGHSALPSFEPSIVTGRAPMPATTSPRILTDLLRGELRFDGVLVSDALNMAGFRGKSASFNELLIEAFAAGMDVMLWPGPDYINLMERAIEQGRISEARLNQSVERILAMKSKQGLFAPPIESPGAVKPAEGAIQFAGSLAARSLTLVENRLGLLPLDPAKTRTIQLLLATPEEPGAEARMLPLLDALKSRGIAINLHINGNCLDLRKREQAGERFDALIAIFELWTHALKNTMRPTGPMAECIWTIQILETVSPIIVSLGSPYLLHDMPWADTLINAYTSNPHTLRALAPALFGESPFPGKSPVKLETSWLPTDGLRPPWPG